MNPTLLKDLILAGHRVACKIDNNYRRIFMFIAKDWTFQWTFEWRNIDECLVKWLCSRSYNDEEIFKAFAWEYKIVTPLPQLPQPWDTVEVLEICRELPDFDNRDDERKDMIWKKYLIKDSSTFWRVEIDKYYFSSRQVAKCEPDKEQSIQSEEQFWDTIVFNWRTYKAI